MSHQHTRRPRFVMIGGFLGAGKTTAIGRLATYYRERGVTVGIVTNDQASDLVDTQTLRSQGFHVGEVAGACFCCNFGELTDTVARLSEDERPDVLLAEPVGSCTDLVATVVQPLKQLYNDQLDVAPFGVILKPSHGLRILGATGDMPTEPKRRRSGFSPQAAYIFEKQLEEADFVLINRIDVLASDEIELLETLLSRRLNQRPVLRISARTGEGFDRFIELLEATSLNGRDTATNVLNIDYDRYAEGEAELGWLNCSAKVVTAEAFSLDDLVFDVTRRIGDAMIANDFEVAHVKTIGQSGSSHSVANIVSNRDVAETSLRTDCTTTGAELVVNARVAADPALIDRTVRDALSDACQAIGGELNVGRIQSFRPGRPVPTHRMTP